MKTLGFALTLCAASSAAVAQLPVSGLYWNADEPGRGYTFDFQNGTGALTGYLYDNDGNALWFLAAGSMTTNNTVLEATADVYADGQCLGCPYTAPSVIGSLGELTLEFTGPDRALLTIDGNEIPIERQQFGFGGPPRSMLGSWHFIGESSRVGVTYNFSQVAPPTTNPGSTGVFADPSTRAVGECYDSGELSGRCLVGQFDSDGDPIVAYVFQQRTDRIYGVIPDVSSGRIVSELQGLQINTLSSPSRSMARSASSAAASTPDLAGLFDVVVDSGAVEAIGEKQ